MFINFVSKFKTVIFFHFRSLELHYEEDDCLSGGVVCSVLCVAICHQKTLCYIFADPCINIGGDFGNDTVYFDILGRSSTNEHNSFHTVNRNFFDFSADCSAGYFGR